MSKFVKVFVKPRALFRPFSNYTGPLSGREHALEDKFIHDHEMEVIAKLKAELAAREKRLEENLKLKKKEIVEEKPSTELKDTIRMNPVTASAGAFSKREAAAEEQYFRKVEHEKVEHLKHPEKK